MSIHKIVLFAVATLLGTQSWGLLARADQSVPERLYGDGVHSYFAGDSVRAFNSLTMAVQAGSRDPRVYYFRGLAELRLGREPDAAADFQTGGALEATEANGYPVGQSLERIQGSSRAMLEHYRENARSIAFQQQVKQQRAVAADSARDSGGVLLRHDASFPPAELTAPASPAAAAPVAATEPKAAVDAKPADSGDPFGADAGKKPADAGALAPAAVEKPAATDKPAEDPFGATKPTTPAEAAPTVDTPAAEKTAPAKPKTAEADPFGSGDTMPAEKPATTPATKTPAAKSADTSDPFGTGDATKPADKTNPAKATDDKTAAEKPDTAKPADASAAAIKPTPGALKGIFHAFAGALPGSDKPASGPPVIPGVGKPNFPPGVGPTPVTTPAATKGADIDPFGATPAATPTAPAKAAPAAPATKAAADKAATGNPFIDEPAPGKPTAPAAKGAADAKNSDPFDLLKPDAGKPDAKGAMDKDATPK